jgi:hypothetical protein
MFSAVKKAVRAAQSTDVPASQATITAAQELDKTLAAIEAARAKQARVQELDKADAQALTAEQDRVALQERDPERKAAADAYALGEGPAPAKIDRSRLKVLTESRALRGEALTRIAQEIADLEAQIPAQREAFMSARCADHTAQLATQLESLRDLAMRAAILAWRSPAARAEFRALGFALVQDAQDHTSVALSLGDAFPAFGETLPAALPARVAAIFK